MAPPIIEEMLEEFGGDILIGIVVLRQLDGDAQHVEAVHRHPGGAVGLLQRAARRAVARAVEDADIVQAQKAALEDIAAVRGPCGSPTR